MNAKCFLLLHRFKKIYIVSNVFKKLLPLSTLNSLTSKPDFHYHFLSLFFKFIFIWKSYKEKEKQRGLPSADSLSTWPQQLEVGLAEAWALSFFRVSYGGAGAQALMKNGAARTWTGTQRGCKCCKWRFNLLFCFVQSCFCCGKQYLRFVLRWPACACCSHHCCWLGCAVQYLFGDSPSNQLRISSTPSTKLNEKNKAIMFPGGSIQSWVAQE